MISHFGLLKDPRRDLQMAQEVIEGTGELESVDRPGKKISVTYRFQITSDVVAHRGRVGVDRRGTGMVRAVSGEEIPNGKYTLTTDEEILTVQNLGMAWTIVSS
jgi:hypothetical protein